MEAAGSGSRPERHRGSAAAGPGPDAALTGENGIVVIELTRHYHDALNALDMDAVEACFAPDAIYLSPGVGGRIEGRDAIMAAFRAYFDLYPDQISQDDLIEAVCPGVVRTCWQLSATHARTGEAVHRQGDETISFDSDGLIAKIEVRDRPATSI